MSPYHMPPKYKLLTDLLITANEDHPHGYHAKKLICKLREIFQEDKQKPYLFYKEYPKKMYSPEEKIAYQYSFLINSLLLRWIKFKWFN